MATKLDTLQSVLQAELGEQIQNVSLAFGELTVEVAPTNLTRVMRKLRDHLEFKFEILVDLCGADYSSFGNVDSDRPRFAAIYHLLSLTHNWRLRVRTFAANDEFPVIDSLVEVWPGLDWYEREAFDLFGIVFTGHPDLRRLLTDYGFVGHPFRKDFPLSGNVEVRYDPEQKRVIYQPVTIEPREIVPRIIREDAYGESE